MTRKGTAYPKVDFKVPSTAKLSVAHLEGDSHLIIAVEGLMEAFSAMRAEEDGMS